MSFHHPWFHGFFNEREIETKMSRTPRSGRSQPPAPHRAVGRAVAGFPFGGGPDFRVRGGLGGGFGLLYHNVRKFWTDRFPGGCGTDPRIDRSTRTPGSFRASTPSGAMQTAALREDIATRNVLADATGWYVVWVLRLRFEYLYKKELRTWNCV